MNPAPLTREQLIEWLDDHKMDGYMWRHDRNTVALQLRADGAEIARLEAERVAHRDAVAVWMIEHGYATGHGDTVADMLGELEHQARGREAKAHEHETHIHRLAMVQLKETTSTLNSMVAARQRARIAAFKCVADWLETKAHKARTYPGGDPVHAKGRVDAYGNAASEVRCMQQAAEEALGEGA